MLVLQPGAPARFTKNLMTALDLCHCQAYELSTIYKKNHNLNL